MAKETTTESEPTPGPWEPDFVRAPKNEALIMGVLENGTEVTVARAYGGPTEANARLIAAAPELAEALEAGLRGLEHHPECKDPTGNRCDCAKATMQAALDAAKGGS